MNIIYDGIYNSTLKQEYLNIHKKGTQMNLDRIFKMTRQTEEELGKDLFDFTREELRMTFFTFMASTKGASKSLVSLVNTYIDWAIECEYKKNDNPLDSVDLAWKEQFVIQPEKVFFTDDEIYNMLNKIVSAQVACTFYAPFKGIRGIDNAEIVKLKKCDIDEEACTVKLTEKDGSIRKIEVDDKFISLCHAAIEEEELVKSNGEPDANIRSDSIDLVENEYIVRSADMNTKNYEEADGAIVYRRFRTLENYFKDKRMTPMIVAYSGMLAMAKDLYVEGKLTSDGFLKIANQFNLSENTLKRHQKDFLNILNIKSLYEIS